MIVRFKKETLLKAFNNPGKVPGNGGGRCINDALPSAAAPVGIAMGGYWQHGCWILSLTCRTTKIARLRRSPFHAKLSATFSVLWHSHCPATITTAAYTP